MQRYVIEREISGVGRFDREQLGEAAKTSNTALAELAPRVKWEHSYVTAEKTFCIYLAENEDAIREHAELSGFPASRVTPVTSVIDPTTANRTPA